MSEKTQTYLIALLEDSQQDRYNDKRRMYTMNHHKKESKNNKNDSKEDSCGLINKPEYLKI